MSLKDHVFTAGGTESVEHTRSVVGVLVGTSPVKLFALAGDERLARTLARLEVQDVRRAPAGTLEASVDPAATVLLFRADYAFDKKLVMAMVESAQQRPDQIVALYPVGGATPAALHVTAEHAAAAATALFGGDLSALSDVKRVEPQDIASTWNEQLRKQEVPFLIEATPQTANEVEERIFDGAYKGVSDLLTLYVWRRAARHVTGLCARLGLSPNQITFVGLLLTLATIYLFWHGHFLAGLGAAWLMAFLDTVDGKLARVTLTSSQFGNLFDHSIDIVHPPFWYWAWVVGVGADYAASERGKVVLGVIVAGYVLQRMQEGLFISLFGIEMHIWRPFDSTFRLVTARRNPNILILLVAALLGAPQWGIECVAGWTAISLAVHTLQIVQAGFTRMRGRPVESWLVPKPAG